MADFDVTKKYLVKGSTLKRLADIVRHKIGKNVSMTLEQMGNYIFGITGDGSSIPSDGILITGDASYLLIDDAATAIVESAGDRIFTANLTDVSYMFSGSANLTTFPFTLNAFGPLNASGVFKDCTSLTNVDENMIGLQGHIKDMDHGFYNCEALESLSGLTFNNENAYDYTLLFSGCENLKEIGYLENMKPSNVKGLCQWCYNLKYFPEVINFDGSVMRSRDLYEAETGVNNMFYKCFSLRSVPEEFLKGIGSAGTDYYYTHLYNIFQECYALDEIKGLSPVTGTVKSNMFKYSFQYCCRLKELTFATQEDGTPYEVEWAGQTIDLSGEVGYARTNRFTGRNSGITTDKKVSNAETYAALKDDPDWWTDQYLYSRYNHDSAVNTINSLPDTSAFQAANGYSGTANAIIFRTLMGRETDGGKIGDLTPEEIAVATAKGWTVTLKNITT